MDFYPGGRDGDRGGVHGVRRAMRAARRLRGRPGRRSRDRARAGAGAPHATASDRANDGRSRSRRRTRAERARGSCRSTARGTRCRLQVDGAHNLLNAAAAVAAARAGRRGAGRRRRGARRDSPASTGGSSSAGPRGARRSSTTTGTSPTELAVTLDVARRTGPDAARRGVPTAPVLAHAGAVARARREPGRGRPRRGDRRVRCGAGPDPGRHRQARRRRGRRGAPATRVVYLPHRADVVGFLDREVREGDLVLTMGCGDVWMLGDAALERIGRRA